MGNEKLLIGKIRSAKEVGSIAARLRKEQAFTQADLAGLAQTGNRFISDLENGKGTVQFDKVMHILDLLGLDVMLVERK
ncbi:MAG: helix-turn-helix domain-containing protein [Methylococcales bacterium]|nr:helix-turn-helix domain-containing protein [Methylococcales bacterium]